MGENKVVFEDLYRLKSINNALCKENELLHLAIDSLKDAIVIKSKDDVIHCNKSARKILGQDFLNMNLNQNTFSDKLIKQSSLNFTKIKNNLLQNKLKLQNLTKDKKKELKIYTKSLINSSGQISGNAVILNQEDKRENFLDNMQLNSSLQKQLDYLPIPTYIWKKTENDFILINYNKASIKFTHKKICDFLGKKLSEMYSDSPEIRKDFYDCYLNKKMVEKDIYYKFRSRNVSRELKTWYVYIEPDMIAVYTLDISETKEKENEIKKLWKAVEQTADGVVITNKKGIIEYVNPAFENTTGYKNSEAVGKTPRILKSGLHENEFYENIWQTLLSGKSYRGTLINKKKCGEIYWCEQTITPMKDEDGEITNFVSVLKDITELRKKHEQEYQLKLTGLLQKRLYKKQFEVLGYDIVGRSFSAVETDGDFYDFVCLPDGNIGIVLADVSGHGITAAFIMAETRAYLRAFSKTISDPGELLQKLNNELSKDLDAEHYVTMIFISLNPREKKFSYVNAGHLPIYSVNAKNMITEYESNGIPIGICDNFLYETSENVNISEGDLLLLITDGVLEAQNENQVEFEKHRLFELIKKNKNKSSKVIINRLYEAVKKFGVQGIQEDDITAVVCKINGKKSK